MYYTGMATVALTELSTLAKEVLGQLSSYADRATVLALQGPLGAGKTTFAQALARELGVEGSVQSPTYVLMKSYPTTHAVFSTLVHIDAYRLENPQEFLALKPEGFFKSPQTLVCIEWPERVAGILPKPDLTVRFSTEGVGESERTVVYE